MTLKTLLAAVALAGALAMPAAASPEFWKSEWPDTNFDITNVESWTEILSGGPPKDGIPALSDPTFIDAAAESRLGDREPVITVEFDGETPRAYPIRYLTWHEIVNDEIGGIPVAVTFCPLCNSGLTFDRRVDGRVLTFGVSGKLRNSDMVMYDRETQSWWQQALGEGIVGEMTGMRLEQLPTWMESWAEFRARNPGGLVMDQPGWPRPYGANPYQRYDSSRRPFLYNGEMPPHGITPLARVVRVGDRAWTMERIRTETPITEAGVTLTWSEGQASALDTAEINAGKEVGTVRVRDAAGNDLPHDVMFAFAYHAFWPEGDWMLGN
ncbi:DUF3179 domain-containing protein [Ovoidimarina sediminis]|uniref:DUF3179 domain-containing protein n=1 Tax=Ovoidimarina sediminis TaxID=3079856 RepID=UPI0029088EE1|nr:DUF3179 domain-containing protein [Rhodophyticola sp. MJ-SS7]MDU8945685.1 DUF3179 domain-containing protein [Rhodophyticola sp. MJ-SS7]